MRYSERDDIPPIKRICLAYQVTLRIIYWIKTSTNVAKAIYGVGLVIIILIFNLTRLIQWPIHM